MKILFLCHYFAPEVNAPATRTLEHGRVWASNGHALDVATCVPNHPKGQIYPGYKNRLLQSEVVDGVTVHRLLTFTTANRLVAKRIISYIFYMIMAILAAPFLPRPDIVVSTSPQFFCGFAGYFVSRIKRVPWVLEIRDLWPESAIAVGAISSRRMIRLAEWAESFMYRKADAIISVTDSFVTHIENCGARKDKIHVIKNGVDLAFYNPDELPPSEPVDPRLVNKFVAAYVGTHGMAHALETVLHAAEHLRDRQDIVFLLVGEGAEKEKLEKQRAEMNLENVVMLGQQPKDRMPAIWGSTDVSLVLLRDTELFKTVIPSKIVESMAMKRPVVLGVRGESQAMVEESGGGVCIEPENARDLAAAVVALADDPDAISQYGQAGREYVKRAFDRSVLAERYEKILDNVRRK